MKNYQSFSSEETKKLGERFAKKIKFGKAAVVFALKGDLGAGKTTFAQGFFKGLGLKGRAQSPTFIVMRRHALKRGRFLSVFHIDAYRLKKAKDLTMLGLKNIFREPRNIVLIEWADRAEVKKILPKGAVWLDFAHGGRENERSIMMRRQN